MGRNQTGGRKATDYSIGKGKYKITSSDVAAIVRCAHERWNGVGNPTIDIDASIFLYRFFALSNGPINELAAFAVAWAEKGLDVVVLDPLDGFRDDTKRATVMRVGDRASRKLQAFEARVKLMRWGHCLENPESRPPDFTEGSARAEISRLERTIKAADKPDVRGMMSEHFPIQLGAAIDGMKKSKGCGNISIIVAKVQADSTISYRLIHGISQMVLSCVKDASAKRKRPRNEKKQSKKRASSAKESRPKKKRPWKCDATINLFLPSKHVKRRTGFPDMFALLRFVLIACNGNIDLVRTRISTITWLEEWFLFFEWTWGRSFTRLEDAEEKYSFNEKSARRVIQQKRSIILLSRQCWPFFATHEEDKLLRAERWKDRYSDKRIVFWDNTNINIPTPSDASLNRRTYSSYYGGNVGKGGVFVQLCGWLGTWSLWTGAVSDSSYLSDSGILEMQQNFALWDKTSLEPFTIVLDKGYRCNIAAWRRGKQTIMQPTFAKSDEQFTTDELLYSAAIATDRGGNERAVNVCKRSGLLKRGLANNASLTDLDNAWLAWSFQTNFMYNRII
jgi:hypothetical protein